MFTGEFGKSPGYYRHNVLPYREKLQLFDLSLTLTRQSLVYPLKEDLDRNVSEKGVEEIMEFLSDVKYVTLPEMTVLSATLFGSEPEEKVINLMHDFAKEKDILPLREFGFDVPVESDNPNEEYRGYQLWLSIGNEDAEKVQNLSPVNYHNTSIEIKRIPSYRYASLTITDPFQEAFVRIPAGWKALVSWLENNDLKEKDDCQPFDGYCLEEVREKNGLITMDIFIPVGKL